MVWFVDDPWGTPKVDLDKFEQLFNTGIIPKE